MNPAISRESIVLIAICVVDTVLTMLLLAMGLATEANPIMAYYVDHGLAVFCLVKLGMLIPIMAVVELYRRQNPVFIRRVLRAGIAAYIGIYFVSLFTLNVVA